MTIDLNADAGESFGHWTQGNDEALFPYLSSVNLACGFHAGDPLTMQRAVKLARAHGVAVGAHPGFMDKVGFGRRDMSVSPDDVYADVLYQLGALDAFLTIDNEAMHHVKAHGALYIRMFHDQDVATAVATAVHDYNAALPLVVLGGQGGDVMREAAQHAGVRTIDEAFPDRAYLSNGRLATRRTPGSVLDDPELIAQRAVQIATGQPLAALDGGSVTVEAQTLCLHGDHANAPQTARAVKQALSAAGVSVRAYT